MNHLNIRVNRSEKYRRYLRTARYGAKFIRTQVEAEGVENKEDLARKVWIHYFKLHDAGMLVNSYGIRRILRHHFGFWESVGLVRVAA